jgi:hypothetical protein
MNNWLQLNEVELIMNDISYKDVNDADVFYDQLRAIIWVKPDSPTATLLALKGCRFNQPDPHKIYEKS